MDGKALRGLGITLIILAIPFLGFYGWMFFKAAEIQSLCLDYAEYYPQGCYNDFNKAMDPVSWMLWGGGGAILLGIILMALANQATNQAPPIGSAQYPFNAAPPPMYGGGYQQPQQMGGQGTIGIVGNLGMIMGSIRIFLDGREIAKIRPNGSIQIPVSAGQHAIYIKVMMSTSDPFHFQIGNQQFIQIMVKRNAWTGRMELKA